MEKIAQFRRPQKMTVADAADAQRKLDAISAAHPALDGSLDAVRHDLHRLREKPQDWTFIMLGPIENAIVMEAILSEARRPAVSLRLWANMICHVDSDTGEIDMNRQQMMEAAGTKHSGHITVALKELHTWGALIKDTREKTTHWFFNPRVATHLAKHARPWAQQHAPNVIDLSEARRRERTQRRAPKDATPPAAEGTIDDERQPSLV
jgi:hypothetical protein